MNVRAIAIAAIALSCPHVSLADILSLSGEHMAAGVGTLTCARWSAERRAAPLTPERASFQSWVQGYLSAVGAWRGPFFDPLDGTDPEAVWKWIDRYCEKHPKASVDAASGAFVQAHPNREAPAGWDR